MNLYLDNCCFNRPFDTQTNLRVRMEAEAKLAIQDAIRSGQHSLVWSYILDYENSKNPYRERREQIAKWASYATVNTGSTTAIKTLAESLLALGLKQMDALHLACAIETGCDAFLTTDKGILRRSERITEIQVIDPISFIQETFP